MAVTREDTETKLTLVVNTGTQSSPSYKNRIFNYINPISTDISLYTVAGLLGGLQSYTVDKVKRTDTSVLESDA